MCLLSGAASLFAGLRVGGRYWAPSAQHPQHGCGPVAVYFFLLELCDAASCSLLCAIGIAQQWSVTGQQLHEGSAWFWEVAEANVCLVVKRVRCRGRQDVPGTSSALLAVTNKTF